jgi:predicted small secreted protein
LKEKLKKTIVRIVKEHFKKVGSIKGLYKDERDHFYSELYAYLVEQMKNTVK